MGAKHGLSISAMVQSVDDQLVGVGRDATKINVIQKKPERNIHRIQSRGQAGAGTVFPINPPVDDRGTVSDADIDIVIGNPRHHYVKINLDNTDPTIHFIKMFVGLSSTFTIDLTNNIGLTTLTFDPPLSNAPTLNLLIGERNIFFIQASGTTGEVRFQVVGGSGGGGGDMLLAAAQTVTGAKTFEDLTLLLRNTADTFSGAFTAIAVTATRVWGMPDGTGNIIITPSSESLDMNGFEITGGGIAKGMTNVGQFIFIDNTLTPGDPLAIFSDGTDLFANTGGGTVNLSNIGGTFSDDAFRVHDNINLNADFVIDLDGATDTFETALKFNQTADRVATYPDASFTLAGLELQNIFTDVQEIHKLDGSAIWKLYRDDATPTNTDPIGEVHFEGQTTTTTEVVFAKIRAESTNVTHATRSGRLRLSAINSASQNLEDYIDIDGDQDRIVLESEVVSESITPKGVGDEIGRFDDAWLRGHFKAVHFDDEISSPTSSVSGIGADSVGLWLHQQTSGKLITLQFNDVIHFDFIDTTDQFRMGSLTAAGSSILFRANSDANNITLSKTGTLPFVISSPDGIELDTGAAAVPFVLEVRGNINGDELVPSQILLQGDSSTGTIRDYAGIKTRIKLNTDGSEEGALEFEVIQSGVPFKMLELEAEANQMFLYSDFFMQGTLFDFSDSILSLAEQTAPAASANASKIYSKDVSSVTHLFTRDSDGEEHDLSLGGGLGLHSFSVNAGGFISISALPFAFTSFGTGALEKGTGYIPFVDGTTTFATYLLTMPGTWDLSAIDVIVYWKSPIGGSGDVVWGASVTSISDAADFGTATYGTEETTTTAAETGAPNAIDNQTSITTIAIGETPIVGDQIVIKIQRRGGDGADDYLDIVNFEGIKIIYTTNAGVDP